METLALILVWLLLLALKGFFSGSEIAIVNADKIKLQAHADQGHAGSRLALGLFRRPERLLATTLVGTNISTVALAVLTTTLFLEIYGDGGDFIALLVGTPLLLIFGEIVPKSVYQQSADEITPVIAYPLRVFSWLFFPVVLVFSSVARLIAKVAVGRQPPRTLFVVREQLRTLIDLSERAAELTVFDRVRIKNVIRFADITVGEAMTPIADIVGVQSNVGIPDVVKISRQTGHHHIPVYEGNITNITGLVSLSTWDLIDPKLAAGSFEDIVRTPHFVTVGEPVDELFSVLRERDDHAAVVVDEYGSAIGMITIQDVTRLVVGQIGGGRAARQQVIGTGAVEPGTAEESYEVDARYRVSQLNELLGTDLTSENFHTVGGFLAFRLRRVPGVDDTVEEAGFRFTVIEGTDRGPTKIRIERLT
ncbi:MAG: hemolysin family protein [Alphaproteobacteria bacterium]|nr:hemolysin family protein [Alphaproteobacteria bacterium]